MGFFSFDRAFSAIGRLLRASPAHLLANMWFTHGFASLVIFAREKADLALPGSVEVLGLRAREIWTLEERRVVQREHNFYGLSNASVGHFLVVRDFSRLEPDLCQVLVEFRHCIYTAVERSLRYVPDYVASFSKLIETVNQIIEELLFITGCSDKGPPNMPEHFSEVLRGNALERRRRINHRTDHIIQLNSALSYVLSQAFAGTIPILERECQVQSYSLLGLGGAGLALFRFAEFVQEVFRNHPLDTTIVEKYSQIQGVEIFPNISELAVSEWEGDDLDIDKNLRGVNPSSLRPKLVFYSGRLGFKESEFSVTAALQVLSGASTARWSLMTLTHELMHAHVRALVAVIFKDLEETSSEEAFGRYYEDLQAYRADSHSRRWKLIESLRSMMLNYILQKRYWGRLRAESTGRA